MMQVPKQEATTERTPDMFTSYLSINEAPMPQAFQQPHGRLVVILERELQPVSRAALKELLRTLNRTPEPTFVASLSRPAFLGAVQSDLNGVFYNADCPSGSLAETMGLLPWAEVWMVAGGKVWQGLPSA